MIEPFVRSQLKPMANRHCRLRFCRELALCWAVAAVVALGLIAVRALARPMVALVLLGAVAGAAVVWVRSRRRQPDFRALARRIELEQPDLHALLLTAVEQQPDPKTGKLNYLQERVVNEAVLRSLIDPWRDTGSRWKLFSWQVAQLAILALLASLLVSGWRSPARGPSLFAGVAAGRGVTVVPGDASLERGSSLVVFAQFSMRLPPEVTLVVSSAAAGSRRIPLVKNLADPVFGGSIPEVTSNLVYHVEYAGERTRDFKITVFEHPRLERADARVTYPEYTRLADRKIEDARWVSAVEGSHLDLTLKLNKPVASARLVARDKTVVPLAPAADEAFVTLTNFPFETSRTYELQLVDSDGRTNKIPSQFVIDVLKDRPPELKIASPRGDQRPSALEEIAFQGEVWGEFGIRQYGLTYQVAGQEASDIVLGGPTVAKEKRPFNYLLPLEHLGVEPDQLISWFVWAEDSAPNGGVRRTSSDMFFAEVRPFDEIYREGMSGEGEQPDGAQQGSRGGNQSLRLAELQKQIINATWKVQREESAVGKKPSKP